MNSTAETSIHNGKQTSLFRRFKILFISCATLILLAFGYATTDLFRTGATVAMEISMLLEGEEFKEIYQRLPTTPPPNRKFLKSYLSWQEVPERYKKIFPQDSHSNRKIQFFDFFNEEGPVVFFMPFQLTEHGKTLYMIREFDPDDHLPEGAVDEDELKLAITLIISVLIFTWLAFTTIGYLLTPLKALDNMVQEFDKNKLDCQLPEVIRNDEIGTIAKKLQKSMQEIKRYHQRELDFLRNASHELRTPIAITRSALDIIDKRLASGQTDIYHPIQQIRHANLDMGSLSESLLQLARGESSKNPIEAVCLHQAVCDSIEDHKYLLEGTNKQVSINKHHQSTLLLDPVLLHISIANLIRNAFEHSAAGDINIEVQSHKLVVSNYSADALFSDEQIKQRLIEDQDNAVFGLGLKLVLRIANQQSWLLDFDFSDGEVVKVSLDFGEDCVLKAC